MENDVTFFFCLDTLELFHENLYEKPLAFYKIDNRIR